jgi:K+-transporting ATPase ATPase C chain
MLNLLRPALAIFAILTALTGIAYPAAVGLLAQALFREQAHGSLVRSGERTAGSALIGQRFSGPRFFWSRPSATAAVPYDAAASAGSNLGPSNPALQAAVAARIAALRAADPRALGAVPVDLVTASGSGLDPHISPAAAFYQVPRVARARGLTEAALRRRVEAHIEGRTLGLLGEPRVNVLLLNLDLERD